MEEHKHCNYCGKPISVDRDICEECVAKAIKK